MRAGTETWWASQDADQAARVCVPFADVSPGRNRVHRILNVN